MRYSVNLKELINFLNVNKDIIKKIDILDGKSPDIIFENIKKGNLETNINLHSLRFIEVTKIDDIFKANALNVENVIIDISGNIELDFNKFPRLEVYKEEENLLKNEKENKESEIDWNKLKKNVNVIKKPIFSLFIKGFTLPVTTSDIDNFFALNPNYELLSEDTEWILNFQNERNSFYFISKLKEGRQLSLLENNSQIFLEKFLKQRKYLKKLGMFDKYLNIFKEELLRTSSSIINNINKEILEEIINDDYDYLKEMFSVNKTPYGFKISEDNVIKLLEEENNIKNIVYFKLLDSHYLKHIEKFFEDKKNLVNYFSSIIMNAEETVKLYDQIKSPSVINNYSKKCINENIEDLIKENRNYLYFCGKDKYMNELIDYDIKYARFYSFNHLKKLNSDLKKKITLKRIASRESLIEFNDINLISIEDIKEDIFTVIKVIKDYPNSKVTQDILQNKEWIKLCIQKDEEIFEKLPIEKKYDLEVLIYGIEFSKSKKVFYQKNHKQLELYLGDKESSLKLLESDNSGALMEQIPEKFLKDVKYLKSILENEKININPDYLPAIIKEVIDISKMKNDNLWNSNGVKKYLSSIILQDKIKSNIKNNIKEKTNKI